MKSDPTLFPHAADLIVVQISALHPAPWHLAIRHHVRYVLVGGGGFENPRAAHEARRKALKKRLAFQDVNTEWWKYSPSPMEVAAQ